MTRQGEVALVTGASSGIGRALPNVSRKGGASVVGNYYYSSNQPQAEEVVEVHSSSARSITQSQRPWFSDRPQ
jgi:NAD(P)-dependent dehydrogenase (short-subunit alcohol dehydrogenase family)